MAKVGRKKGQKNNPKIKYKEYSALVTRRAKENAIKLLESLVCVNLSQCADKLGFPRLALYRWKKEDLEWSKELELCDQVIADAIEEEMMQCVDPKTGKVVNQAYFLAHMARLKALRPNKYREKMGIDITDSKVPELLAELREAAKKRKVEPALEVHKEEVVPVLAGLRNSTKECV